MKLFIHDEKHEQINGSLELGNLSVESLALLEKIVEFLDSEGITDRYKRLVFADGYKQTYPDGESLIEFE